MRYTEVQATIEVHERAFAPYGQSELVARHDAFAVAEQTGQHARGLRLQAYNRLFAPQHQLRIIKFEQTEAITHQSTALTIFAQEAVVSPLRKLIGWWGGLEPSIKGETPDET